MCGIAGLIAAKVDLLDIPAVSKMGHALKHRGPDGTNFYNEKNVAFAHTRLSIIDIENGNQPLDDKTGAALIANGEIYNFIELRRDNPDLFFSTLSDCELPLKLYPRLGLDVAANLRGMYALAIHDRRHDTVILSRDPFGIKPLYYTESTTGLAFASEPQALIKSGFAAARNLSKKSIYELLSLQFTTGRNTIYRDINRVLPGETIQVKKGEITCRKNIPAISDIELPTYSNEKEALLALNHALMDSVKVHQRSDVPYGIFLSGGVDSSAIISAMSELNQTPVKAFTACFSTGAQDEREQAKLITNKLGAEHIEISFDENDFISLLPTVAAALDDPVADYAALPTFKLGRKAGFEGIKVILSGEGGDEMLAGYGRYRTGTRPWWLGKPKIMRSRSILDQLEIFRETPDGWRDGISSTEEAIKLKSNLTPLQQLQMIDCCEWLPNDLLLKLDRCLMSNGVEGRTPFLDPMVSKIAFSIPDKFKIRGRMGKWLLRKWLHNRLPSYGAFQRKRGFTVPVGEWINSNGSRLGSLVAAQSGIAEICIPDHVKNIFLKTGKHQNHASWLLLFYALWHNIHVLKAPSDGNIFECLES